MAEVGNFGTSHPCRYVEVTLKKAAAPFFSFYWRMSLDNARLNITPFVNGYVLQLNMRVAQMSILLNIFGINFKGVICEALF